MKRIILTCLIICTVIGGAETPFQRGINLTNWMQTSSAQQIQFTKYTRQDLMNIKSLGCDVIRLPVNLHAMTDGAPDYTIDSLFYYLLDQIVDMAEALELHLIIDNHTFDPAVATDPNIVNILTPVWTQIADHYQNRSNYIYYEILNEPHGIANIAWNAIQYTVIEAIRAVDQTHTIIVGPAGWNSYHNLQYLPEYDDDNLIYTFHFYDPFLFTHQGASWTDPSMVALSNVPFPYDSVGMPACPSELQGSWIESELQNYQHEGTVDQVKALIDIAAEFQTERDVPLFCGEFGVYKPNSDQADRVYWYQVVRNYLEEKGIAWTTWDYKGGFGLFEAGTSELFDYDLNIPLVEALGLNAPPQSDFSLQPDTTSFDLYRDFIGANILESSWISDGQLNYYAADNPVAGNHCICWANGEQYNQIGFTFRPIKDLSILVSQGYLLDFWVKGDTPGTRFDIRFLDTKSDDLNDHPWRMGLTIDETLAQWNSEWHHVQIPLDDLIEKGSWDNGWFDPQGDFDWTTVEHFQIVAEHHDLVGQFWFDEIRIIDPQEAWSQSKATRKKDFKLHQNFPNPFNPITTIDYEIPQQTHVLISVYDLQGRLVETLVNRNKPAGYHSIKWDASQVSSGLYVYRIKAGSFTQIRKCVVIK